MKMKRFAAGAAAALLVSGTGIIGATPANATGPDTAQATLALPEVQRVLKWMGPYPTQQRCQYNIDTMVMNSWQLVRGCQRHHDGKWWFRAYM